VKQDVHVVLEEVVQVLQGKVQAKPGMSPA